MDISYFHALSRDEVRRLFRAIHAAFEEHIHWVSSCHARLYGGARPGRCPEEGQVCDAAECIFGRWFRGPQPPELLANEAFRELGTLHDRLHDAARAACREADLADTPPKRACAKFIEAQRTFFLALGDFLAEVAGGDRLFDPLTGVLNRQAMAQLLRREQARAERTGQPCALALADLDNFKRINDTFGHDAGDRVLELTARRFAGELREYDLLFRIGGEEFLFCLPNSDKEEAMQVCERLRHLIAEGDVALDEHRVARITTSIGVTLLDPGQTVEEGVHRADLALYDAKQQGRDRVAYRPPGAKGE